MIKHKMIPVAGALLMMLSACTKSFEEYNTNQHEATEDMLSYDNLKTGAFFTQMERNVVIFQDGTNLSSDYQVSQGMTADIYAGYYAPTGTWYNGVHNGSYYFITSWIEKTFTSGFSSIMPAWQSIVQAANADGLPEVSALATIVKVEGMHRVADAYGPVPYINYGSGSLQNNYNSLQDVYKQFFNELDSSIITLTNYANGNPGSTIFKSYDYIYGGDVTKWIKFANTLRLRLALRVAYADPALAKTEAEKSVNQQMGLVSAVTDRAVLQHSANLTYHHPLYDIAYNFNAGEARMSASMDAFLNGYKDPRISTYFVPAASDGKYHGVRLGIQTSVWSKYVGADISNLKVDQSTSIVWMTAAESWFLRAEGALWNWNMGGSAQSLYEQGITTSFAENNAGSAASYIADATSTPAAFTDHASGSNFSTAALSTITIAWNSSDSFEKNQERILTQKWIAMYPDGPEAWAEFRRTGYPKLLPVVANNSGNTINTATQVRRIPYPQSEYTNNATGVATGVAALGGQDNGGTKLWWDKK
jgi:hypothetical protein